MAVKSKQGGLRRREVTATRREATSCCPVQRTLDVMGDAWTVLILRDLFVEGARRYLDLQTSLRGISPNTLSDRLKRLEDQGIIERKFYSEHPPRAEYDLTEKGRSLGPIMIALRDWGRTNPS